MDQANLAEQQRIFARRAKQAEEAQSRIDRRFPRTFFAAGRIGSPTITQGRRGPSESGTEDILSSGKVLCHQRLSP
jgi:hypothetical protein